MLNSNSKRIVKNTLMLYCRQMIVVFVSLYTVRIILEVLGVEDYGVYNVVGGVVAILSFLTGTMTTATQRFFSFYLGKNDAKKLKQIFSVNILIYLLLIGIVFLLLETIGLWFITNKLQIPHGREAAVQFVYQFSILTFVANMLASPFIATINANEDMHFFAYISIIEALLKLATVFILRHIDYDKLEAYAIFLFLTSLSITMIYIIICLKKYDECQFRKIYWDKPLFKEIITFSAWTLFGSLAFTMRVQGVTILMNQFFSPITVAARSIASQVTSQLHVFTNNFNTSLYPPIIKNYSSGKLNEMYELIFKGTKIAFFLVWVFALPLFLYMEEILTLWLKTPPAGVVLFTRLALFEIILHAISHSIMTAARATGKMKGYELTFGIVNTLLTVAVWIAFTFGAPAYFAYIIIISINLLMFIIRLIFVRNLTHLPLLSYTKKVIIPMAGLFLISSSTVIPIFLITPRTIFFIFLTGFFSILISCITMYYIGLEKAERLKFKKMVLRKIIASK